MRRVLHLCVLLAVAAAAVVTLQSMTQPDIKERLRPDLDKYLK